MRNGAYHPAVMGRMLLYGYCRGVVSSRKIEQATYEDVAFRLLGGGPAWTRLGHCFLEADSDRQGHVPGLNLRALNGTERRVCVGAIGEI
jgi:hypothetical protein